MNKRIALVEKEYLKKDVPAFKVGDSVAVHQRIVEGDKTRIQVFEGIVVRRRGSGINETFSVLHTTREDQIEKIFPIHSPAVEKIKVKHSGPVKKAKLYHLRKKKEVKISSRK
jgi:large subunit ribosomal protein L19